MEEENLGNNCWHFCHLTVTRDRHKNKNRDKSSKRRDNMRGNYKEKRSLTNMYKKRNRDKEEEVKK